MYKNNVHAIYGENTIYLSKAFYPKKNKTK